MSSFLVRCYPAGWRTRYGDEFEAILEERPLGPFDVADILLGALDAQLRLRGRGSDIAQGRGFAMSLRVGGIAAIVGAALLAVAAFLSYGLVPADDTIPPVLLFTGLAVLLVALAGLSAFQARLHPRLTWGAFAMILVGTIVAVIGSVAVTRFGDDYWGIGIGGLLTALVGSALFAFVTYRAATLSRAGAVLLGIGSVLPFVGMNLEPVYLAAVICFLAGWFALGVQAIRLDRPANAPRPA
jgi:uncharacterized membrane protein YeaQ/YmgE (transglycosylase-associated protein family)